MKVKYTYHFVALYPLSVKVMQLGLALIKVIEVCIF